MWCRRHREFHLVSKRRIRSSPVRPRCHPNSLTLVSTQMKLIVAELSVFWVNESGFLGNPEGVILRAISEAVLAFAVDFWQSTKLGLLSLPKDARRAARPLVQCVTPDGDACPPDAKQSARPPSHGCDHSAKMHHFSYSLVPQQLFDTLHIFWKVLISRISSSCIIRVVEFDCDFRNRNAL